MARLLILGIILGVGLTGCIVQSLERNKNAVDVSTSSIIENSQAIEEANRNIAENSRRLQEINVVLKNAGEK